MDSQLARDDGQTPDGAAAVAPAPRAPVPSRPDPAGIKWARYSGRISYSTCNEDSHCELKALKLGPSSRVFAITAGGGRVLNLLVDGPAEITAVDVNPCQSYLLELKIAAMRALDHAAYLGFMGVRESASRRAVYEGLRPQLSAAARGYFDAHPNLIAGGPLFGGSLEHYLKWVSRAARLVRPLWIHRLFGFRDLAAQRAFVEGWDGLFWRALVYTLCRRGFLELFSKDPGFWRFVPEDVPLHARVYDLIFRYLLNHLARDNHLLQLVFYGRYINEDALPPYLNAATYDRVRAALARTKIHIVTAQVADVLRGAPDGSFDAYSITDVSSYLSEPAFKDLMDEMVRTARPGARLCSRGIFVHRELAPEHARRLRRDPALERRLAFDDMATVHQFLVATFV
jgi:S-adenosylmethionine-diacylglycerol 3-amino-3-carboxypropyl transferase